MPKKDRVRKTGRSQTFHPRGGMPAGVAYRNDIHRLIFDPVYDFEPEPPGHRDAEFSITVLKEMRVFLKLRHRCVDFSEQIISQALSQLLIR